MAFFNADKNFIKSKEHGSGNTALHMACRNGHLVSSYIDINILDAYNQSYKRKISEVSSIENAFQTNINEKRKHYRK